MNLKFLPQNNLCLHSSTLVVKVGMLRSVLPTMAPLAEAQDNEVFTLKVESTPCTLGTFWPYLTCAMNCEGWEGKYNILSRHFSWRTTYEETQFWELIPQPTSRFYNTSLRQPPALSKRETKNEHSTTETLITTWQKTCFGPQNFHWLLWK
jgi:hypothetical protein